jgi:hypothetical protein
MYSYITPSTQTVYQNPQWAPPYSQGVRYYYLPDIETYYDLSSHEFISLSNGEWVYSRECPSVYSGFDLNNSFTVGLNVNIYQPWMHHQYYVSHYPRYYYRDYYDHGNIPYVRGFNENNKSAIYYSESERNRARSWDDRSVNTNRQFKYSNTDRQQQHNTYNTNSNVNTHKSGNSDYNTNNTQHQTNNSNNNYPNKNIQNNTSTTNNQQQNNTYNTNSAPHDRNANTGNGDRSTNTNATTTRTGGSENESRRPTGNETTRAAQTTNYYGRTIGQPVRVEKQMRQQPAPRKSNEDTNTENRR